jgi:drug/metabolite transporter (DMT)-like permease
MTRVYPILAAVFIAVIGQLIIKRGINLLGEIDFSKGLITSYLRILTSPYVIVGSLSYGLSVFFWLYALAKVNLSYAYPFLALSYGLVLMSSRFFLGEEVSLLRWLGVLVICFGVFLVSKS